MKKDITTKARILLIRFAKVFPFVICFILALSLSDCLQALITEDYVLIGSEVTLNIPFAWFIAKYYEYSLYSIIVASVLAVSLETCIYNRLATAYLVVQLGEKELFSNVELDIEWVYFIVIANLCVCLFFVYKGIKTKINAK